MQLDDQMSQQQFQQEQPPPPQKPHQHRLAQSAHAENPELLWCTAQSHYANQSMFGEFQTCQRCRDTARAQQH